MVISVRKRRGRRIVLFGLFALLSVQGVMTYGINRTKLYWADPEYGTAIRNLTDRKKEFPERPLVVSLGTSRSRNGFAADRLSEPSPGEDHPVLFYNACLVGSFPFQMQLMLRRLVAIGAKPAAVTIELFPALMREFATPEGGNRDAVSLPVDPKREAVRLRYDDFDLVREFDRDRTWSWTRAWLSSQSAPWYTQRYTLTSRYAKSWAPQENVSSLNQWTTAIGPYGYCPIRVWPVPEEMSKRADKVTEDAYAPLLHFTAINGSYDLTLRALLKYCADEKITVLGLVCMPESGKFRSWYAPETKRLIRDYAKGLASEFGTRFVDANDWVPDDQFLDGHHLVERGSILFSERFRGEVLRPWAQSHPQAPK